MAFDLAPKGRDANSRLNPLSAGFRIAIWIHVALITVILILPVISNIARPGGRSSLAPR